MTAGRLSTTNSVFLDLIRFAAAVIVFWSHITQARFSTGFSTQGTAGHMAVCVFFVLSGFVIRMTPAPSGIDLCGPSAAEPGGHSVGRCRDHHRLHSSVALVRSIQIPAPLTLGRSHVGAGGRRFESLAGGSEELGPLVAVDLGN
jgi:hypothetical protein